MKTQSRFGVTISGTSCNYCTGSIAKYGSDAIFYGEPCVGLDPIEWQVDSGSGFITDQVGGLSYNLIGFTDILRVKLSGENLCTKYTNVL